ncbi:diaminopropionate ammonia-lyase [Nakamurella flavida]|uniref:Diaminopropionate ammonia-lyase n=1 Tax=Nakamurella flavida TaxID=363630 RepID=A0A939C6H1_9ACTN|nr:diaminopropionate ammonia-lyase [Nakamurella flavida]MBM9478064.1 diaminopropionate ammonia-lyase [Nakamurella flavida]MDP9778219.1 diaminopropionate ammonia-lyase [Nakamurella flavida]
MDVFQNPAAGVVGDGVFGPETREPAAVHSALPGYAATPLVSCPSLARRLGVASVLVKDEASRLGLPSFKILGASWATLREIGRAWLAEDPAPTGDLDLLRERLAGLPGRRRLVAATDGNHGRGVARMARLLGLECEILLPEGSAQARLDGISSEGATVLVVPGDYDDAVAAAARYAAPDTLVISDTSWPGYDLVPREVVRGYSTMFFEIDDQLAAQGWAAPTVVALQAGVGAFAAAGLRHYRATDTATRTVLVEPDRAACLLASARAGGPVAVPGPHLSSMAGLNCGAPSPLAWPVVAAGTDVFVAIGDQAAEEAMRALAAEGIAAGESGAASLGGLLAVVEDGTDEQRAALGLTPASRVLLVNTEGVTDPVNYRRATGLEVAAVG